ncbi:MAG: phosphoribosylformylglycinamidine synthase subunit PurL [bacterium]|jgi:phosphoribosylformylglycinamidine synthase II
MAKQERWAEMGLNRSEYERILSSLGREPNDVELGIFAVMWSEHCSYKTSRPVLKLFPTEGARVLQGPGENAGIVDIGDGQAVVMKIESHNHPSAIEPYQGAATGVGGIVRDIFTMGARPVALLDSLRFGNPDDYQVRRLVGGVVSGIGGYGNCIGVPTVGGETFFADTYAGNPLVNAMGVGLIESKAIVRGKAVGEGNPVMLVGARTGRDGIHGATFASEELSEETAERRPAVQAGDPFLEKLLMEACLELIGTDAVIGIQDLGAAGLTSSCSETAGRGGSGMDIDVALVPRREEGMTPYEVMLSESQERMLVIVQKGCEGETRQIFTKYDLLAVQIGTVTGDGILRVRDNGTVVAEVPVKALTEEAPTYYPEYREAEDAKERRTFDAARLPEPADYGIALARLLASPNIADKEWIYRQYDSTIMTDTVLHPGGDAAVLRIKGTPKGIALTTDCNGRFCYLDPYTGGGLAVAEAARNLACVGARPLAVTDCLNFGSPAKPEIFWQFRRAVEGMSDACRTLDTPVISGNVSFYNETNGEAIYPTPIVGMIGLLPDLDKRCSLDFKASGDVIILLGATKAEIGGSEYMATIHGRVAGIPPVLDLAAERNLIECLLAAADNGLLRSAHDCAEGGLAVAVAECCFAAAPAAKGAEVDINSELRRDFLLFGETAARAVISVAGTDLNELLSLAAAHQVPAAVIGRVSAGKLIFRVNGEICIDTATGEMEKAWREAIECLMG